jgi:hypothetical protein
MENIMLSMRAAPTLEVVRGGLHWSLRMSENAPILVGVWIEHLGAKCHLHIGI